MSLAARPDTFFKCLTHLNVYDETDVYDDEDPLVLYSVLNYVLAHARHLTALSLMVNIDNFDNTLKHVSSAQLEELDLSYTNVTDAAIDVLCQTQASSLRHLVLKECTCLTRQGSLLKVDKKSKNIRFRKTICYQIFFYNWHIRHMQGDPRTDPIGGA